MNDQKGLAVIVLIIAFYFLYLHIRGRLVPAGQYLFGIQSSSTGPFTSSIQSFLSQFQTGQGTGSVIGAPTNTAMNIQNAVPIITAINSASTASAGAASVSDV